jgi:hypothetical protein
MKQAILFLLLLTLPAAAETGVLFEKYFEDRTLRVDYFHTADKTSEFISIDHIYWQEAWSGNPNSLIDPFNNGKYYVNVVHQPSGKLIYSRGFSSYCGEYITTDMAAKGIKRTYHETALIPLPREKIIFTLLRRGRDNRLKPIFKRQIDPYSSEVIKEALSKDVTVFEVQKNGRPHRKVDLAFIAEGYTARESGKFKQDLEKVTGLFFEYEPYKSHKKDFNVYGVFKASQQSGTDEPTHDIFKRTAVGSTFNALGLYRYNLTEENRALHDIAAHAPYDAIVIIVNNDRYGGGGIYNSYCLFTLDDKKYGFLFLHEFGHAFGGLADEYYAATVAYNEFFPPGVEPTEPNITALLDPGKVPTPWEKEKYDKMNRQQKRAHRAEPAYKGKIGAFEGAGYASKGLYRPAIDCLMHTSTLQPYCKVCEEAIIRVIKYHTRQ